MYPRNTVAELNSIPQLVARTEVLAGGGGAGAAGRWSTESKKTAIWGM
jgi:hypothetical protein